MSPQKPNRVPSDPLNVRPKSNVGDARSHSQVKKKSSGDKNKKNKRKSGRKKQSPSRNGHVIPKMKLAGNEKYVMASQGDPSLLEFAKLKVSKNHVHEDFYGSASQVTSPSTLFSENVNRIPSSNKIKDMKKKTKKKKTGSSSHQGKSKKTAKHKHKSKSESKKKTKSKKSSSTHESKKSSSTHESTESKFDALIRNTALQSQSPSSSTASKGFKQYLDFLA